ncbi:5-hydroxytryptamine receptor 3A-like [Synchiropus splendidus]|uniref:5-hydroxytryptamine receptor 3A-like n=1 Tax=Synchiropus splendidus TaxID=270530 RepID=UPI00237E1177|nr:5-hydroxytryptamine receptor 3A-like [Synchiropus splendidus]
MTGRLFFLLSLSGCVICERHCRYQDVLDYLNLSMTNELYQMTRPVNNYKQPTKVYVELVLYAILDVVEKEQKFIPYVWMVMTWHNDFISWDPREFCGINNISLPADYMWKPDLTIEEMTERDRAPPSPYLSINDKGAVEVQNDQVLVSTCRMHIYKFPFDIQSCNLSIKSVIHTIRDIRLYAVDNSSEATEWSREVMRTQYEWLFINMTVTSHNTSDFTSQDVIIYTINMKRRSILYIVNFLLPVLFFLCLDLSSFLISDDGGEKLSFKVTVLLAVTVLQLILNEILPASSNRIPLIAVYCIGIFGFMMLSLLETILVMHLMQKDSKSDQSLSEDGHKPTNFHDDNSALGKLSQELREMERTLTRLLNNRKDGEKHGYWTQLAFRVNKGFFIFYVTLVSLFLVVLFSKWIMD